MLYPPNMVFHHEFNQEACGCWLVYDIPYGPRCLYGSVYNPYQKPFSYLEGCILQEEYDKFFDHGFGFDCLQNSGDEPSTSISIDVDRAMSQGDCPAGTYFSEDACACFADN